MLVTIRGQNFHTCLDSYSIELILPVENLFASVSTCFWAVFLQNHLKFGFILATQFLVNTAGKNLNFKRIVTTGSISIHIFFIRTRKFKLKLADILSFHLRALQLSFVLNILLQHRRSQGGGPRGPGPPPN